MSHVAVPRLPQQQRSRATMEQILTSAQELLAERGIAALTINEVATRAGVAIGTIYRRFSGKDGLIDAVQERWMEQIVARQRNEVATLALSTGSFEELVVTYIGEMIKHFRRNATLVRELSLRAATSPESIAHTILRESFAVLCDTIMAHPDRPAQADRPRVVLAFRAVQSTLEWRVTTPETQAPDNDWGTLADQLPQLALHYLTADAGSRPRP